MEKMQRWQGTVKDKRVLFITTKNIDYIRNIQEVQLLKESAAKVTSIYSDNKRYIFRVLEIYIKLFFVNIAKVDVVFVGFSPQLILPFFYEKFQRKEIIVDFFISVYDTIVNDRKKVSLASRMAKWCHFLDEKTLKRADYIISDTKAHAKYFEEEFDAESKKIETLYLQADTTIFFPREKAKPKQLEGKFIVLYFGSILPLQGIEIILTVLDRLKERNEFYFFVIGKIGDKYKKSLSENIEYIDWLPQEKLAEYISIADLCLAGHFNGEIEKAKRTIPGKAYIYEAMLKPMILGDNEANREVFLEDEKHYFVEMGSAEKLEKAILEIREIITSRELI